LNRVQRLHDERHEQNSDRFFDRQTDLVNNRYGTLVNWGEINTEQNERDIATEETKPRSPAERQLFFRRRRFRERGDRFLTKPRRHSIDVELSGFGPVLPKRFSSVCPRIDQSLWS